MNHEQERLEVVATRVAGSLTRATNYYQQLAGKASNVDDLLTYLGEAIESARVALEECLRGHDSFDLLAFLRLAVRESETRSRTPKPLRTSSLLRSLGNGLLRQPSTGENSGQPSIGKALGLAFDTVTAAQTCALVQGRRLEQPLGALEGEFLGYELSVRGRQYQSFATELNTGHLGVVVNGPRTYRPTNHTMTTLSGEARSRLEQSDCPMTTVRWPLR